MPLPPRLYATLTDAADPALEAALQAGLDGLLVPGGALPGGVDAVAGTLARIREAGREAVVEIDLERGLIDHVSADLLVERVRALVDRGATGVRLAGLERIAAERVHDIARLLRERLPELRLWAGPFGYARATAHGLAAVDALIASYGWWDYSAPWFAEEMAALAALKPVLVEVRPHQLRGADDPIGARRRVLGAVALGDAILPASVFADAALADQLAAMRAQPLPAGTRLRRLTDSEAPVTALLRSAEDVRTAENAALLLFNRRDTPEPVPAADLVLPALGSGFALPSLDPLGAGEVRVVPLARTAPIGFAPAEDAEAAADWPRLVIEAVAPAVSGGAFAVKRVVGETLAVSATIYADGHEQLAAEVQWRPLDESEWRSAPLTAQPNDLWTGAFPLERLGRHLFRIEAWLDRFGGFRRDFAKKLDAGVAQLVDHEEGKRLVREAAARADLGDWVARLDAPGADGAALLLDPALAARMAAADDRPHRLVSSEQLVDAERLEARFSSWYEIFPRSMSGDRSRHGRFEDVIAHLPRIRDMGFDTLYFPPIHPIGRANRKGPNNSLTPAPGDPGSPYAIGSEAGGHDAIHPELGSFEDFARLIAAARDHGLEIALDFAIQCSPDHPWLKAHPGWFAWRPDGSMKYAENPPKKYQDIVNVDFYGPDAVPGLWQALRDVVLLWVEQGVKTFRVDNPHTKPLPFWEWMIGDVRARHPEVIFLAEAFTRPAMMYRLAKIGFSQSYTYFTWRNTKQELTDYLEELTTEAPKEFYRPHFFVNTPDINPYFLQTSGRPGFRIRAVLAATLSGLFGVYSGFELCEAAPLPGKEEYLDSEKYELRPRDWAAPGNIVADITLLNGLRRAHPALQTHLNTRFLKVDNDAMLYYAKPEPQGGGMILVLVNLDPHAPQEGSFEVPLWEFDLPDHGSVAVEDLARGYRFDWHGKTQTIRLEPDEPYRIWRIAPQGGQA
ncbi:maltotransferase domain-containing protein [Sphingomonas morindae]|uniref:Alpha-1,4-glucan:maltose-1-phosphate maltosyltransferase n=1 Tax=Sphingomonas morindae TaxID=1541170 RepID=A0ABY4XBI0_9SPHN|nr:maltotransferase domain-containing protein [Sphingomonas morindae]USI74060.1 DUF3416 domain-containing protein [Sphingomonas morindae]